jgi:hypothetical protein
VKINTDTTSLGVRDNPTWDCSKAGIHRCGEVTLIATSTSMSAHFDQDSSRRASMIFVLAGGENRKRYALELFKQGLAGKILFSVARFEIRRFSQLPLPVPLDLPKLAANVRAPERHFFVCFEGQSTSVQHVQPKRFGTLTEVESLGRWLEGHPEIRSLSIISSAIHLRRIRMCCHSMLDSRYQIELWPVPYESFEERNTESKFAVFLEMWKTLVYWVILRRRQFGATESVAASWQAGSIQGRHGNDLIR